MQGAQMSRFLREQVGLRPTGDPWGKVWDKPWSCPAQGVRKWIFITKFSAWLAKVCSWKCWLPRTSFLRYVPGLRIPRQRTCDPLSRKPLSVVTVRSKGIWVSSDNIWYMVLFWGVYCSAHFRYGLWFDSLNNLIRQALLFPLLRRGKWVLTCAL